MITAAAISEITNLSRFNGSTLLNVYLQSSADDESFKKLSAVFSDERLRSNIIVGLLRFCFLIEIVNDKITSTKVKSRWQIGKSDPRYASYVVCQNMFEKLIIDLNSWLKKDSDGINFLRLMISNSVLSYEIPVDYISSEVNPIHTVKNVEWFFDKSSKDTISLRALLLNPEINSDASLFSSILRDKVKVKVYLTDRVLTGEYKTNREKRWEAHPQSVHFATRKSCLEIEHVLMSRLFYFENFPLELRKAIEAKGILSFGPDETRCPITFEHLDFNELKKSILDPQWGRSSFQVGHMYPLKAKRDKNDYGHIGKNISWVTADGNRLQGHLTVDQWNALLDKILKNKKALEDR